MSAPKDLPGFYFDPEKNRYFPIKNPIPGSKRPAPSPARHVSEKKYCAEKKTQRKRINASDLFLFRELNGGVSRRCNFKTEYQKLQVSRPAVWKYQTSIIVASSALEQLPGVVQTPQGLKGTTLLLTGSTTGSFRLYEVGDIGRYSNYGNEYLPEHVWPHKKYAEFSSKIGSIWSSEDHLTSFLSRISCIQRIGKHSPDIVTDGSSAQHLLVTTLGSGVSSGTVYCLKFVEPLDFSTRTTGLHRRISKIASGDGTVWTADCNSSGTQATIGTNKGAALINIETGRLSWIYRTKSDILSQKFDQSGNVVFCGLRNGAIISTDIRQRQSEHINNSTISYAPVIPRSHTMFHVPPTQLGTTRQRFEHKKNLKFLSMPSSVCSLLALRSDDQYIIGSSMDGSIKLFDRRLLHRAVQSYEGHVNSHSHLQIGVDPSETFLISGGEDCFVRIWSIKSSELIFEQTFSNSIISTICRSRGFDGPLKQTDYFDDTPSELDFSWGVWLGSREGLFYMRGS